MSQFDELPEGWEEVRIEEIAQKVGSGATPRGGSKAYKQSGIPLIRSMNVHFDGLHEEGIVYLDDHQADGLKNVEVKANDVLLNITGASIGRVTQAPEKMAGARVNQHVCIIRPTENFDPTFLTKYLTSPKVQRVITAEEYGMTRQALTKQMILDFEIPLPPLNEQRRIVEKIEALTARSRKAREALEAIPELLDQFRQSVLAAAFRGDLTADWREQNPDVEPAEALLERIRVERRKYWEDKEMEKFLSKNKPPKNEKWKLKYKFPIEPETEALHDLPPGWVWATWDQISNWVTYGFTRPMPHVESGIPIVTAKHVIERRINLEDTHKTNLSDYENLSEKDRPQKGDILITKDGSIGRAAIVNGNQEFCINQSVAVIWLRSCPIEREYLMAIIESPLVQKQIALKARGNAIQHLSITDFAKLPLPIPPKGEQEEIVKKIKLANEKVHQTLNLVHQKLAATSQLDQSILAKAFRGELVPHDPHDEPAAVLLDRIRAERSNSKGKIQNSKRKKGSRRV